MRTFTLFERCIAFFVVIAGILWLGGTIIRAALAFDLFVPGTLTFKPDVPSSAEVQTLRLFARTSFYTLVGYGIVIVAGLWLWVAHRHLWRERGAVFAGGMLILLYLPIELWQAYYDILLILLAQSTTSYASFPLAEAKELLLKRMAILGGAGPFLAMLGYMTAVFFFVVQPLRFPLRSFAAQPFLEREVE